MSIINTNGADYAEEQLIDNWAAEYAKRTITEHRTASPLDHPDGSVTTAKLGAGAVTAEKLGNSAVTADKLANEAVTTAKLDDFAVSAAKIQTGAVTNDKIMSSSITSAKLVNGAVLTDKIGDGAVTTAKIADGGVTTAKVADGAITTAKIAAGAVTEAKLDTSLNLYRYISGTPQSSTEGDGTAVAISTITFTVSGEDTIYYYNPYFCTTYNKVTGAYTWQTPRWDGVDIYTDDIADGAVTEAKLANGAVTEAKLDTALNGELLRKTMVSALPSTTVSYDFEDGNTRFTAVERCTLTIQTEGSDKYLRVTTGNNTMNKYALSQLNLTDIGNSANTFAIEMDTRIPASRWYISLVDLTKRPGDSYRTTYDNSGVAFSCGTTDGSNYNVNGTTVFGNTFVDTWLHMRLDVDIETKKVKYDIQNRSTDTTLATGTVNFNDSATDKITGIELYSYLNDTTLDIDNIKVTAGYDIEENQLYFVDGGGTYAYFDNEPVEIGGGSAAVEDGSITTAKLANGSVTTGKIADGTITAAKIDDGAITAAKLADGVIPDGLITYSTTTQRIGTWIDGTPVWRKSFDAEMSGRSPETEEIQCTVSDANVRVLSVSAFASDNDYMTDTVPVTRDESEYVFYSFSDGNLMLHQANDNNYNHFSGYIDFVTAESNVSA